MNKLEQKLYKLTGEGFHIGDVVEDLISDRTNNQNRVVLFENTPATRIIPLFENGKICGTSYMVKTKDLKLIQRPYSLTDILEAMNETNYTFDIRYGRKAENCIMSAYLSFNDDTPAHKHGWAIWQLRLPLHKQSKQTRDFLEEILL